MLAGISLTAARKLLGQSDSEKTAWTSTSDIRKALAKKKIRLGRENYCNDWLKIGARVERGLVAVSDKNIGEENQSWHWVVYDRADGVPPILDPNSRRERRNPGKLRAYSYFYVSRE